MNITGVAQACHVALGCNRDRRGQARRHDYVQARSISTAHGYPQCCERLSGRRFRSRVLSGFTRPSGAETSERLSGRR
jgi:hypothetical protein